MPLVRQIANLDILYKLFINITVTRHFIVLHEILRITHVFGAKIWFSTFENNVSTQQIKSTRRLTVAVLTFSKKI